ncbi:hypothetical protein EVAR_772_1 [Eumeta japonica]|uniref:Uncharacterized protein n=1 Tax=Eumeta variegata TaxID=151549 RepID=A0A4C1SEZ6_EUMVA|nr:hypothetical protein EVAR_772_1 [Eumeta japonica]
MPTDSRVWVDRGNGVIRYAISHRVMCDITFHDVFNMREFKNETMAGESSDVGGWAHVLDLRIAGREPPRLRFKFRVVIDVVTRSIGQGGGTFIASAVPSLASRLDNHIVLARAFCSPSVSKYTCVRPLSLFYLDASADRVEEKYRCVTSPILRPIVPLNRLLRALARARSAQAERDNESCFFVRAASVHRFIRRQSRQKKYRTSAFYEMSREIIMTPTVTLRTGATVTKEQRACSQGRDVIDAPRAARYVTATTPQARPRLPRALSRRFGKHLLRIVYTPIGRTAPRPCMEENRLNFEISRLAPVKHTETYYFVDMKRRTTNIAECYLFTSST